MQLSQGSLGHSTIVDTEGMDGTSIGGEVSVPGAVMITSGVVEITCGRGVGKWSCLRWLNRVTSKEMVDMRVRSYALMGIKQSSSPSGCTCHSRFG